MAADGCLPRDVVSSMKHPLLKLLLIPPPIHHEEPDSPPGSILLDPFVYLSPRTNSTTAKGVRSDGESIFVTLWVATPPRVSCITVHCTNEKQPAFGGMPKILCTEDDLILIRVPVCPPLDDLLCANESDYFIYEASSKNKPPSLKLVRIPGEMKFSDNQAVLLRCRDRDMFFLAAMRRAHCPFPMRQFDLHLYNSDTERWTTKLMDVDAAQNFRYRNTDKVITIGGQHGTVAWVDLWHGILICDLLRNNQELRYIELPMLLAPNPGGNPMFFRNIVVLEGCIKLFEMQYMGLVSHPGCTSCMNAEGWEWEAATKILKFSDMVSANNWEEDCRIKFSDVPVNSPAYARMLPLQEGEDTKLTLKRLRGGYPALSLHDQDVVYITSRPDSFGYNASVIAVDMRNKTIKDVADFGSERPIGYCFIYLQSAISKHLDIWSSTR
ncbi:hypothetical protein PR202_gb23049 [Eleusine coracana subsp. coracana]|uniref:DUF1618 domain-containing protein n=1 Tax=Eleusine coracana subsp. coracana TaxID=191504 RepID=A0AAV5FFB0_ELECO|nr:hypothetical protein PR202_gb23049 [Eleusine coracana subsp. coracana]